MRARLDNGPLLANRWTSGRAAVLAAARTAGANDLAAALDLKPAAALRDEALNSATATDVDGVSAAGLPVSALPGVAFRQGGAGTAGRRGAMNETTTIATRREADYRPGPRLC